MRIAMGIEYDGAPYVGWQRQTNGVSVQACVEQALSQVADSKVVIQCAGRTDTGVHACQQVIHFDTEVARDKDAWVRGCNANLPKSIAALWATPVSDEFHARFSAVRRRYRYVIYNRSIRPTFLQQHVTWVYRQLDEQRMQQAADYLIGEHDFSSYRAVACQAKSPIRNLYRLEVTRKGEYLFLDLEANGFLHHMVRNIAGVLIHIGGGEKQPQWAQEILQYRDRTLGGVTASACGLYLMGISYPKQFEIPVCSCVVRF